MSEVGEHQPDPDGRLIDGRYRLLERIGAGGSGTVWRALDQGEDLEVAVKQPRIAGSSGQAGKPAGSAGSGGPGDSGELEGEERRRAVNRLCHEARVAARLDHPSAIAIHDVVVEDGFPWVVMEYVRGESLGARLLRGTVSHREAARIGLAVLGALRAAHAAGMVHRDLKPANVLLGEDGRVLLTDFGIAHGTAEDSASGDGEFVAPEQLSEFGAGPASDLWSLGALLYAAVEGTAPSRAAVVAGTALVDEPVGPLGALVVRMLAREPEERPGAAEVAVVLEAVAEGRDVPGIPLEVPAEVPGPGVGVAVGAGEVPAAAVVPAAENAARTDSRDDAARDDAVRDDAGRDGAERAAPSSGDPAETDPGLRTGPLRRLLTGLGFTLPPVPDPEENPDHHPSARAIR